MMATQMQGSGVAAMDATGAGWSLDDVVSATGGRTSASGGEFRGICIDSRRLEPGDLFVAIRGDRFDGHDFIAAAVAAGAAGVVADRPPAEPPGVPLIMVADTLAALGDLAAWRRRRMKRLRVLAVTGSSGKTTVKEMCARVLARNHAVIRTGGNFNNLVGLPLSLLPVEERHRFAVLEMGMNRPGEIARLTEIADPDIGCINNIQPAHLQGLGDVMGVARAKGELFAGMRDDAVMAVNLDDPLVVEMAARHRMRRVDFGFASGAAVTAGKVRLLEAGGTSFTMRMEGLHFMIRIRATGRHNVANCLAAAAMTLAAGETPENIAAGLDGFEPFDKRFAICRGPGGVMIINDAYNANPASMQAAFETLRDLAGRSRAAVVVGDMLELGDAGARAHRTVGETVARMGFDFLFAHGGHAADVVDAAVASGLAPERALVCPDREGIVERLRALIKERELGSGDWILVKGSRSMQMEAVVDGLTEGD